MTSKGVHGRSPHLTQSEDRAMTFKYRQYMYWRSGVQHVRHSDIFQVLTSNEKAFNTTAKFSW